MINKIPKNKGYTLLFSIIIASVVLSMAAFVLSVSRKQFILTSAARDSTIAIYAADSGMQCAIEAFAQDRLATSTSGPSPSSQPATIRCNSDAFASASFSQTTELGLINETSYKSYKAGPIQISLPNNTCARVTVYNGYDSNHRHKVIIDSRGYNIADSGPCSPGSKANPRAVERAIRVQYSF